MASKKYTVMATTWETQRTLIDHYAEVWYEARQRGKEKILPGANARGAPIHGAEPWSLHSSFRRTGRGKTLLSIYRPERRTLFYWWHYPRLYRRRKRTIFRNRLFTSSPSQRCSTAHSHVFLLSRRWKRKCQGGANPSENHRICLLVGRWRDHGRPGEEREMIIGVYIERNDYWYELSFFPWIIPSGCIFAVPSSLMGSDYLFSSLDTAGVDPSKFFTANCQLSYLWGGGRVCERERERGEGGRAKSSPPDLIFLDAIILHQFKVEQYPDPNMVTYSGHWFF